MVAEQHPFPLVHDLSRLLGLLPTAWRVRTVDIDWSALTDHAVEARYPDVSTAEAEVAVAERIVEAVVVELAPLLSS